MIDYDDLTDYEKDEIKNLGLHIEDIGPGRYEIRVYALKPRRKTLAKMTIHAKSFNEADSTVRQLAGYLARNRVKAGVSLV